MMLKRHQLKNNENMKAIVPVTRIIKANGNYYRRELEI